MADGADKSRIFEEVLYHQKLNNTDAVFTNPASRELMKMADVRQIFRKTVSMNTLCYTEVAYSKSSQVTSLRSIPEGEHTINYAT